MSKATAVVTHILVAAAAGGAGFLVGRSFLKKKLEAYMDSEIESFKEAYFGKQSLRKEGAFATPQSAVDLLINGNTEEPSTMDVGRQRLQELLVDNSYTQPEEPAYAEGDKIDFRDETGRVVGTGTAHISPEGQTYFETDDETLTVAEDLTIAPHEDGTPFDGDANAASVQEIQHKSIWDDPDARAAESAAEAHEEPVDEFVPAPRSLDNPFRITFEEWDANELNVDTTPTLTYYEEDGQMTDERDRLVPNIEELVGLENLDHFGYGSIDKHTLYILNPKMGQYFEVIRDMRSFSEVVLGSKPEDNKSPILKMRSDD